MSQSSTEPNQASETCGSGSTTSDDVALLHKMGYAQELRRPQEEIIRPVFAERVAGPRGCWAKE